MREIFSVVFAADDDYIQHLSVAILSLLKNNTDIYLSIYLLCSNVSDAKYHKLENMVVNYNASIKKIVINDKDFGNVKLQSHFTITNYYRYLIPKIITTRVALYLDADIVVLGSIKDIYEVNIGDKYIAAITNPNVFRNKILGMRTDSNYFNAGVMLINIDKWKRDDIGNKAIKYANQNHDKIKFADQDALNAIIDGNWIELHPKYNVMHNFYKNGFAEVNNQFPKGQILEALDDPVVLHYSGPSKPWHLRDEHEFKKIYWHYLKETPFYRMTSTDMTFLNIVKYLIPRKLGIKLKKMFL